MLGNRVLVIDDDRDSLRAVCEWLRRADYEVLAAETGREGLRLLHGDAQPDLVVLDFWLPDMTGPALLTTRKRWPSAPSVPVLLMISHDAWVDEQQDLRQLGVLGLLHKPVVPEALLAAVAEALGHEEARHPRSWPERAVAPVVLLKSEADTAVAAGGARQARRLSDLLTRVSDVLAQGTDLQRQLREVGRAIVPAYASACVIERTDVTAGEREVLWTQHESVALEADLRRWACQPDWLSSVLTEAAETGKPRLLDLQAEADKYGLGGTRADLATARALGFESVVVAPMIARSRTFGLLTCASRTNRRYGRNHLEVFADLGHRVALALDNAELISVAQQLRRERDDLLSAWATELQAPLAALLALAQEASQATGAMDDAKTALIDRIWAEAKRMQQQLGVLTDLGLVRAGRLPLHMQTLDLAVLLRRVVDAARQVAPLPVLNLRVESDAAGQQVRCDPERTAQALQVLLQAAAERAPSGSEIDVTLSRVERDLQVTIADPGPALSTAALARLSAAEAFEADAVAASSQEQPAVRLRLARALIDAQAGRFCAQATETGSIYQLSLPMQGDPRPELKSVPATDAAILLVDSDLAFRRELQEILSERGYHVETADNGLQAWQYLLGHHPPALILFDLMLPAMDGWELYAAIKGHAALQHVPTVVVSGLDRYRIEASLPDAEGYIEKPIRTAQLFDMVQRHVATPARPRTLSVRPGPSL